MASHFQIQVYFCPQKELKTLSHHFPFQPIINIRGIEKRKKVQGYQYRYVCSNIYTPITYNPSIFDFHPNTLLLCHPPFRRTIHPVQLCRLLQHYLNKNCIIHQAEPASDTWHAGCTFYGRTGDGGSRS